MRNINNVKYKKTIVQKLVSFALLLKIAKRKIFHIFIKFGRVRELLINSEKARISSIFKKDAERFLCLQFSITHAHYLKLNQ